MTQLPVDPLVLEKMASFEHDIWVQWMTHLFSVSIPQPDGSYSIPADKVERWQRQMSTAYQNLPEAEKESDRQLALKVLQACAGFFPED
jgi:hypothetical protein